jgi:hypothetical protein
MNKIWSIKIYKFECVVLLFAFKIDITIENYIYDLQLQAMESTCIIKFFLLILKPYNFESEACYHVENFPSIPSLYGKDLFNFKF